MKKTLLLLGLMGSTLLQPSSAMEEEKSERPFILVQETASAMDYEILERSIMQANIMSVLNTYNRANDTNNSPKNINIISSNELLQNYEGLKDSLQKIEHTVPEVFQETFQTVQGILHEQCFFLSLYKNMDFDRKSTNIVFSSYEKFITDMQLLTEMSGEQKEQKIKETTSILFKKFFSLLVKTIESTLMTSMKIKYFDNHTEGMWEERDNEIHLYYTTSSEGNQKNKEVLEFYNPPSLQYAPMLPNYFSSEKITKTSKILDESFVQNERTRLEEKLNQLGYTPEKSTEIMEQFTHGYNVHIKKASSQIHFRNVVTQSYVNILKNLWSNILKTKSKNDLSSTTKARVNFSTKYFKNVIFYPRKDFEIEDTLIEVMRDLSFDTLSTTLTVQEIANTNFLSDVFREKIPMFQDGVSADTIKITPPKKRKQTQQLQQGQEEEKDNQDTLFNHQNQMLMNPQYAQMHGHTQQLQLQQGQEEQQEQNTLINQNLINQVQSRIQDLSETRVPSINYVRNDILAWAINKFDGHLLNKVGSHEKYSFTSVSGASFRFQAWDFHGMDTPPRSTSGHYIYNLLKKLMQ